MTVQKLARLIASRTLSVPEATAELTARIKATENSLHAYLAWDTERAMADARRIQDRIDQGEHISSLCGVPIALKDNICTTHLPTTCASRMLAGYVSPYSATVAEKLTESGLLLHGKLNMDEFAMGSTTETSYFGATANPWDPTRVPGGSSGGAAAAVAAGSAVCALGSDTGGSVRLPASHCGVTGFKPTYGTVSRYGLVAYASSLEQIGPIARTAADCAALMDVVRGADSRDSTSRATDTTPYLAALTGDIRGMHIGLPADCLDGHIAPDVAKRIEEMAHQLEKMGAIVEKVNLPLLQYATAAYYIIACAEAASNLSRYDGIRYGYRAPGQMPLEELYTRSRSEGFGAEVKRRILLGNFVLSAGYYDAYYRRASDTRAALTAAFEEIFLTYDMLLMPTAPTTAPRCGESLCDPLGMYSADRFTVPANLAGLPALTLPCGFGQDDLPIGAQLVGPAFSDARLLSVGDAYQRATDHHLKRPGGEEK